MTSAQAARKLALKLHALHEDDRDWILERLDDATRQEFKSLLRELEEIGLEPGSSLCLNEDKTDGQVRSVPELSYSSGGCGAILAAASSSTLQWILKDEHPALRNICMQLYPWPWLDNKLGQKSSVGGSLSPDPFGKHTQKVREALIRALANRIQSIPDLGSSELNATLVKEHSAATNHTIFK